MSLKFVDVYFEFQIDFHVLSVGFRVFSVETITVPRPRATFAPRKQKPVEGAGDR